VVLACAILWTAAQPGVSRAAAASPQVDHGRIVGVVVDRTRPAHPVAHWPVTLEIVERGATAQRRTVTDGAGRFVFTSLAVGGIRVFVVRVQYAGVPYQSRVALTASVPARSVPISVYEPTHDRAVIRGAALFAVVETARGTLRVSVVERLENATDRTLAVTQADPLVFPIPSGAEAVEYIGGWHDPRIAGGAIADTISVLPGATQVAYAFGLAVRTPRLGITWALPYGAADVEILVTDPKVRVSSPGFHRAADVSAAGRRLARWSGGPVAPGADLTVGLDGVPVSRDVWPGVAAAVLGILLAAGLTFALVRRPRGAV